MATSYLDLSGHDQEQERKSVAYIHRHRTWFLLLGFALIALGAVATLHSLATTYASMLFLATVLLLGGVVRLIAALSAREWVGSLLLALSGALYIVTGILTFRHPIAAALALTLLFSALLLGMGSFRLLASIWYRFPHRSWLGLSGAISIVLGLLLWNAWPASGLWFIGFCVGIDLLVEGAGWISLCLSRNDLGALAPKPEAAR